jgi:hypothetical protein
MKESGYIVRLLEEKFNGLELIHIPRCLNEATDELARIGSKWQPVPRGIFAGNLYKPSVCFHEEGE